MIKLGSKKPKQERSKTTVDAILEAVLRIFDSQGADGLTTTKIAEKAGVSVGSLYQYFKNKESIFEAILLKMTESNLANFEKKLTDSEEELNIRSLIRQVVHSHYQSISNMGSISTVLLEYAPQILSPKHFVKADERIISFLMNLSQHRNIQIRPKNKEFAFFVCSQAVRGTIFMTFLQRPEHERQAIMDELVDMVATYLEVKEETL